MSVAASLVAAAAACVPLTALGWLTGGLVERMTGDPRSRVLVWTAALLASPAFAGAAALLSRLPNGAAEPVAATLADFSIDAAPLVATVAGGTSLPSLEPLWTVAAIVLALGAVLAFLRFGLRARAQARIVSAAEPASPELQARFDALEVGRAVLRVSDDAGEPMLTGLRRPVVLLPRAWVERRPTETLLAVCAHEVAHLKAGHHRQLWVEEALSCLFWFDPLRPRVRRALNAAREEACDAAVLADASPADRRRYADILIDALRPAAGPELAIPFGGDRRSSAMRRLEAVLTPAAPGGRRSRLLAAGATTAMILTASAAAWTVWQSGAAATAEVAATVHADPISVTDVRAACAEPGGGGQATCSAVIWSLADSERQVWWPQFCGPARGDTAGYGALLARTAPLIASTDPLPGETTRAFATRVLVRAAPCDVARRQRDRALLRPVDVRAATPADLPEAVRLGDATLSVDGVALPAGTPLTAVVPETVERMEVTVGPGERAGRVDFVLRRPAPPAR